MKNRFSIKMFSLVLLIGIFLLRCSKEKKNSNDNPTPKVDSTLLNLPSDIRKPVVSVKDYGAKGDGINDDTKAFQQAIDDLSLKGGGTVVVPRGSYAIDAKISILMRSKVDLFMKDTFAVLSAIPNDLQSYVVVSVKNVLDARIIGGKIEGERLRHTVKDPNKPGEWGMGIGVYSSANILISNFVITDCWGDGIYINSDGEKGTPSAFVSIKNVICRNNRRQGMSILKSVAVLVEDSKFLNTNGTAPQAGIDIEPNSDTARLITIKNSEFAYNAGGGIQTYVIKSKTVVSDITIQNNFLHHNESYGIVLYGGTNITATGNTIIQNKWPKIYAIDTTGCTLNPNIYQ